MLERGLEGGDVKAALGVLRAAGLHSIEAPSGPTTPRGIEAQEREQEELRALFQWQPDGLAGRQK